MTAVGELVRRVSDRFGTRKDSEHEQALIRGCIVAGVFVYFLLADVAAPLPGNDLRSLCLVLTLYEILSIFYVLWIFVSPDRSRLRRLLAMVTDFGAITWCMILGRDIGAPLYSIYLWVILGNGFRFGLKYLLVSTALGAAGFTLVFCLAPPWSEHFPLSLGLLAGTIAVPAYASTLIRKLTEARVLAEAASRAKSRFLAIISHELRTPLNAIIGMSDLLAQTRLDDDQRDMSRTIQLSGQSLLALIDSVLDFSRIEAGKTAIITQEVDIHRALAELISVMRYQAAEKGLPLQISVGCDVPPVIEADWHHIRQILTNLLANAVKFTEQGHVLIKVLWEHTGTECRLDFDVEDTGIGIPEDKRHLIFDAFAQAEDSMNRRFGGSGLGLSISLQLAELMKGRLSFSSQVGQGTCFHFSVPVRPVMAQPETLRPLHVIGCVRSAPILSRIAALAEQTSFSESVAQTQLVLQAVSADRPALLLLDEAFLPEAALLLLIAQARGVPVMLLADECRVQPPALVSVDGKVSDDSLANALRVCRMFVVGGLSNDNLAGAMATPPRHILVAEDNRVNIKVVCKILEKAGHRVDVVTTGDALLGAMEEPGYDAVVADVNMPGMPLPEVVRLHRMACFERTLPVIALSADATLETRNDCEQAGVDAYLTKPVVAKLLLSTIERLTGTETSSARKPADVSYIARHRAFGAPATSSVDWRTIDSLVDLGGRDLVREVTTDFVEDAITLLAAVDDAASRSDRQAFRAHCHALRSCAANVGASGITHLCQDATFKTDDVLHQGKLFCSRAQQELELFREEMEGYLK
ncbi:ATP-binding protein [Telmatospirillum sp.]|uniref:ATP-binding protein n=1 Tax=Telmatospirillum sp. TaxID=2079197 RepID=UPI00284FC7E1|nr:ATP-binding protein [Telmatospirillum sp.]MDR3437189.1 ATP-binding protein [Telmatospirillum sp.]